MSILTPNLITLIEASTGNSIGYSLKKLSERADKPMPVSPNTMNSLVKGESVPQKGTMKKVLSHALDSLPQLRELFQEVIENGPSNTIEREFLYILVKSVFSPVEGRPEVSFIVERLEQLIAFDDELIASGCHKSAILNSEFSDIIPANTQSEFLLKIWAGLYMMSVFDTLYIHIYEPVIKEISGEYGVIGRILKSTSKHVLGSNTLVAAAWSATVEDMNHYSQCASLEDALALERNNSEPQKVARRLIKGDHYLASQTFSQTLKNIFERDIHRDISEIMHLIASSFSRGTGGLSIKDHNDCGKLFASYPLILEQSMRDYHIWQSRTR